MAANQDIVSTVNLDCKLILEDIALNARNAEYNPEICTGAESEEQSMLAARKYAHIIQKLGFPVKFKDFKIVGGSGGLGMPEDIAPAVAFLAGEVNGQIN